MTNRLTVLLALLATTPPHVCREITARTFKVERVLAEELRFGKPEYGKRTMDRLAKDLGAGKTDIYDCVRFAKLHPELSDVSENLSWREITHKLLPGAAAHVAHNAGDNEW